MMLETMIYILEFLQIVLTSFRICGGYFWLIYIVIGLYGMHSRILPCEN